MQPDPRWTKSSRCGTNACVEVARDGESYLIRDGKDVAVPALRFSAAEWAAFVAGAKAGDFDRC